MQMKAGVGGGSWDGGALEVEKVLGPGGAREPSDGKRTGSQMLALR